MKQKRMGMFFEDNGTIKTEIDSPRKQEEMELLPKSIDAIHGADQYRSKVFIITNQSGIASQSITEDDLAPTYQRLAEILKNHYAQADKFRRYSLQPECGVSAHDTSCTDRKPDIGILEKTEAEHNLDLKNSFVDNDRCVHAQADTKAGYLTFLATKGCNTTERIKSLFEDRGTSFQQKRKITERIAF